uniref:NPHP4 Ig-like domain-containing protein n=2 Tax=Caenorhabditis japonica TaxID=281687 RepID=A0A8R1DYH5_CAEJA
MYIRVERREKKEASRCVKKLAVSVVNSNTQSLERCFIVTARSEAPRITQKFVIEIPANDEEGKRKIPIRNSYGLAKTFRITSSHPEIVKILDQLITVPAMGKMPCQMYCMKTSHLQKNMETLLYISDAITNAQEEAYSLTLVFEAS